MKTKLVKKIVSVLGLVFLAGSTLAGATSMDLADYPQPFIKDGKFDATLVVGDRAAAEDVIGISSIASSLQYALVAPVQTDRTIVGDAWQIGTGSKDFGISGNDDNIDIETIRSIVTSIGEDELNSLKEGKIRNNKGTVEYSQYINFDNEYTEYVMFIENEDDELGDYLYIENGDNIATYELRFSPSFKSDIEEDVKLEDYENKKITIMNREFTITRARVSEDDIDVELTLMGGAVKDTLDEGATKTYTINSVPYEVTVSLITDKAEDNKAKFIINGETTDALEEGDVFQLEDSTEIGVTEILPNEAGDPTKDMVTFHLGATKIVLKNGEELEISNSNVDDTEVIIDSKNHDNKYSISSIQIIVNADDDIYVEAGHKVSEYMDEPEALIGYDIRYDGLEDIDTEIIGITGSDQSKELEFNDGDNNRVSVPLVYADGDELKIGSEDESLVFVENVSISVGDYFIVSSGDNTFVLQYDGADDNEDSSPEYKFDVLGGDSINVDYDEDDGTAEIRVRGDEYSIKPVNVSDINGEDFDILVDLDGDGFGSNAVSIKTNAGAEIEFEYNSILNVTISTDPDDCDNPLPGEIKYGLSALDDEIELDRIDDYDDLEKDGDLMIGYTTYGARIEYDSKEDELEVEYPEEQRLALAFITSGNVTVIEATPDIVVAERIEVTAIKLASEIAGEEKTQNLILVGGPCANTASEAIMMGNYTDCLEGFEAGKGLIRLYENEGYVALIVAGMNAEDTRMAAKVIADYGKYDLNGTELITETSNII